MKSVFALFVFLLICRVSTSQLSFERTLGGTGVDQGQVVGQITDSTFFIMGTANNFGNTSISPGGMFLAKINSVGDTLWTNCYPGILRSGIKTSDSGFLLVGDLDLYSLYAVKTDSLGDTLWLSHFGTSYSGAKGAVETEGHEYILCGYINHMDEQSADVYLAKLDSMGDTLWTKTYGTTRTESARVIIPASDSNYIIAAWSEAMVWLLKVNKEGDILWDRIIETETAETCYDIHETPDSGFVVTGIGQSDAFLIKTDKDGEFLWRKTYTGAGIGRSVDVTCDGGYILSCYSAGYGDNDGDILLIKTDENGDILWTSVFGGLKYDNPAKVIQTLDSGFFVIGQTQSYGAGSTDFYLIRTDETGLVDSTINELDHEISYSTPSDKYACNGYISINVRGGRPPYSYFLNGTEADSMNRDLCDAIYTFSVYDVYGNEIHDSVSLLIPRFDSIVVVPDHPSGADNIILTIYSKMNQSYERESEVVISNNEIDVILKFTGSGSIGPVRSYTDEVSLGQLTEGSYEVTAELWFVFLYDYPFDADSTLYDTLQFSIDVAPSSIPAYPVEGSTVCIYPNPVTAQTTISFDPLYMGMAGMLIFNSKGQQVVGIPLVGNNQTIGRYFRSKGIYFYVIYDEKGIIATGKLVR